MRRSCATCGAEIPEGAASCDNRGMPVSEAASRAPPRKASAQPPPTLHEESASVHRPPQLGQVEPSPSGSQARGGMAGDGSRRRGALPWVLVAGLVAVVAFVGVVAYLRGGAAMATLPEVVGMSQDEAEEALSSGGFDVKAETRESSEGGEGKVVDSPPPAMRQRRARRSRSRSAKAHRPEKKPCSRCPVTSWSKTMPEPSRRRCPSSGATVTPGTMGRSRVRMWTQARELVREYDEDQLVDAGLIDLFSCDAGERQDFDRPPYLGKMQTLH
jgi:hypothetical protein